MEIREGQCPLGSKCQEVKDDIIYQCPWYTKMRGKDPQTDADIDEYRCALAWLPVLMVEHSMFERQTGAAVESFRNKMTEQNDQMLKLTAGNSQVLLEKDITPRKED